MTLAGINQMGRRNRYRGEAIVPPVIEDILRRLNEGYRKDWKVVSEKIQLSMMLGCRTDWKRLIRIVSSVMFGLKRTKSIVMAMDPLPLMDSI